MPRTPKPNKLFERQREKALQRIKAAHPNVKTSADYNQYLNTTEDTYLHSQDTLRANADEWRRYKGDVKSADADYASAVQAANAPANNTGSLVTMGVTSPSTAWWKNQVYNGGGSDAILASTANSLIPYLASGEQQSIAKWIGENFSDFEAYKTATIPHTDASSTSRNNFFSKDRAAQAKSTLEAMATASGRSVEDLGPGYSFLTKAIGLLDKYGGTTGNGMSRAAYAQMQKDFEELSTGVDSSYVELGRAFLNPSSGGNPLMKSTIYNGRTSSGAPNARLFT